MTVHGVQSETFAPLADPWEILKSKRAGAWCGDSVVNRILDFVTHLFALCALAACAPVQVDLRNAARPITKPAPPATAPVPAPKPVPKSAPKLNVVYCLGTDLSPLKPILFLIEADADFDVIARHALAEGCMRASRIELAVEIQSELSWPIE